MPKDLIDESRWDATRVPVGTDVADAASVEAPFQRLTNRDRFLFNLFRVFQLSNWREDSDFTKVSAQGGLEAACYDESTGRITAVMNSGVSTPRSMESTDGGMTWERGIDATLPRSTEVIDVASDGAGTRVAIHSGSTDQLSYNEGTFWYQGTITGTPAIELKTCAGARTTDSDFVFMVAGESGKVYRSDDGMTFEDCSPSGLSSETIHVIAHTKSETVDQWVAVTDTHAANSVDGGDTWTVSEHGLDVIDQPNTLFWDDSRSRWLLLLGDDVVAQSSDGTSWSADISLPRSISSATYRIIGDSQGGILVAACSATHGALFGSGDGGASWFEIDIREEIPASIGPNFAITYGRGRFSIVWFNRDLSGLFSMAIAP